MRGLYPLVLLMLSLPGVYGRDYLLRPHSDAFVQGHSFKDYNRSQTLDVKEKEEDQTNVKLIRRGFMEIDVREMSNRSVVESATMFLQLKKSSEGALIQLCPALPYTEEFHNKALSWNRQPDFNCNKSLGEVPYLHDNQTMTWDVSKFLQKQLRAGETKIAFAVVAVAPHIYTTFHSMNSKVGWSVRPALVATTFVPPYAEPRFQPVLSASRLQHPFGSFTAVSNGKFQNYAKGHFELIDDKYMQFQINGGHSRSVIRHNSAWPPTANSSKVLLANIRLPKPSYPTRETTFIQIDSLGTTGTFFRIGWVRSKDSFKDYIWATVRTHPDTTETIKYPLFPRPEDFFKIEVRVQNSKLTVKYNDWPYSLTKDHEFYDISFWKKVRKNVFQAGIFLNHGEGPACAQFETLEITTNDDDF